MRVAVSPALRELSASSSVMAMVGAAIVTKGCYQQGIAAVKGWEEVALLPAAS